VIGQALARHIEPPVNEGLCAAIPPEGVVSHRAMRFPGSLSRPQFGISMEEPAMSSNLSSMKKFHNSSLRQSADKVHPERYRFPVVPALLGTLVVANVASAVFMLID
jgi:hypothetical protein